MSNRINILSAPVFPVSGASGQRAAVPEAKVQKTPSFPSNPFDPELDFRVDIAAPKTTPPSTLIFKDMPANSDPLGPDYSVYISPEARAAYKASVENGERPSTGVNRVELPDIGVKTGNTSPAEPKGECQTCASRKYVDRSNDGSVSYQAPTHIGRNAAAAAVSAHEGEHVRHEQANADREGRKVVSQTVTLHSSVCPECGKPYISGGETKTVTKADNSPDVAERTDQGDEGPGARG